MKFSDKMSLQISEQPNKLSATDDDTKKSPSKGIPSKITNYVIFILISEVCLGVYLHRYMDKQYKEIRSNFVHKSEIENYFLTLFESNGLKDELSAEILEKIRRETILSRTKRQNYVYMGCNCETKRNPLQSNPTEPPVRVPMVIPGPVGPPLGAYVDPNQDVFGNQRARLGDGEPDLQNDNTGFQPGAIGMQHGKIYPPIITGEAIYPWAPHILGQVNGNEPGRLGLGVDNVYNPGPIGLQTERPASPAAPSFRSQGMMKVDRNEPEGMALQFGNVYSPGPIGVAKSEILGKEVGKDIFGHAYEMYGPDPVGLVDMPLDGTLKAKEGFSDETATLQDGIHSLPGEAMRANKADNTVSKTGVNVRLQLEGTLSYPNSPLST